MDYRSCKGIAILAGIGILIVVSSAVVCARQNTVIGDMSVGYDLRDRNYDERSVAEAIEPSVEDTTGSETEVILVEDRAEDLNRLFVEPRLTFMSNGITDQFTVSYAPRINFEENDYANHLDHDFGLQAVKNFSRDWSVALRETFFLGDDSLRESDTRTAVIGTPGAEDGGAATAPAGGEEDQNSLSEQAASRRFWRNDLELSTDYIYREDSVVGIGFSYGMLRNTDDDIGGYTEYDRYEGMLNVSYRFNQQWIAEADGLFTRGIFDEPEVAVVRVNPDEDDVSIDVVEGRTSDDLREYDLSTVLTYERRVRGSLFTSYRFLATEYDHPLRDDALGHEFSLGWSYDFTPHLHLIISGGPSFAKIEHRDWNSDYNAYVDLTKDFMHSSFRVYGEQGYEMQNFDGRRSGPTNFWRSGVDYNQQFSENLTGSIFGGYRNYQRVQLPDVVGVVIIEGEDDGTGDVNLPESDNFEYTEDFYDAGLSLSYSFLRWYTVTGGYRYTNFESELPANNNYDEHRFFITLTASKDLFHW